MRGISFCLAAGVTLLGASVGHAKGPHRAHEHGKAKVNLALEGNNVMIELESPAESIYGFEHEAKSPKDVQTRDTAVARLKSEAAKMFVFEDKLGCVVETEKVVPFVTEGDGHDDHHGKDKPKGKTEPEKKGKNKKHAEHGEHSEVHAHFVAKCKADPSGSTVKFALWSAFSGLRAVTVQIVGAKSQGGGEVTKDKDSLKL